VVRKLDRAERQVLIEARLVYATDEFQRSLGLKWGGSYSYESEDTAFRVGGAQENDWAVNLPNQAARPWDWALSFPNYLETPCIYWMPSLSWVKRRTR
ncbi:MAG: hypothetical protein KGY41_07765, partial [Desulfovermiculus sp.]|nr:hypothetical protein [Desulfovermiculus sp.]